MAKLIDLFALAIVAFVLLLPQPTVVFSPGFAGDKSDLDRTLRPYKGAGSYQVHQVLATAYATVLRFDLGLAEAEAGMAQCESQGPRCPEVTQIRLGYLANLMRENAQKGIDATTDPVAAKRMVQAALRATKAQLPESKPTSPAKPTATPPASSSPLAASRTVIDRTPAPATPKCNPVTRRTCGQADHTTACGQADLPAHCQAVAAHAFAAECLSPVARVVLGAAAGKSRL